MLLVLILLLVWLTLIVLLWAGTLWIQGYLYSEPSEELYWRAPAAATVVTLFLAFWCWLDTTNNPDRTEIPLNTIFSFSPVDTYPREPFPKLVSVVKGKEIVYQRRKDEQGRSRYVRTTADGRRRTWAATGPDGVVEAVIFEEDGQKVTFKAQLKDGKLTDPPRYVEEGGRRRVLTDVDVRLGQITVFRIGLFLANILLNLVHFGLWFVCVWLLLRFQWSHALLIAFLFWLVMTVPGGILSQVLPLTTPSPPSATAQTQVDARMCMMSPS